MTRIITRPRALPTFSCPEMTLPLRNVPIWIEVSGMLPLVNA